MKILYFCPNTLGHFPHMYPYYKKMGGLVITKNKQEVTNFKKQYKKVNIITNTIDAILYDPDIIMYCDYDGLPTGNFRAKIVQIFHAIGIKKYFASKKEWNTCEKFDLCLLYGNKILDEFKQNGYNIKHEIIGYPRLDEINKISKPMFNNDRKIVLVAPTWGDLSLLHKFTKQIIELSHQYNVIIKAHNLTNTGNDRDNNVQYLEELYKASSDTLKICGNLDIFPLMDYSDILITDYSASSCEYTGLNKPIIIADPGVLPVMLTEQPDIWKVFHICKEPKNLQDAVTKQLNKDEYQNERQKYFKKLVYNEPGTTATERGITAMKKLIGE